MELTDLCSHRWAWQRWSIASALQLKWANFAVLGWGLSRSGNLERGLLHRAGSFLSQLENLGSTLKKNKASRVQSPAQLEGSRQKQL